MNKSAILREIDRHRTAVKACGLAVVLGLWPLFSSAAQTSAPFNVTVNLQTGNTVPNAGLCTAVGAFAARITVTCSDARFRFVLSPGINVLPDSETGHAGVGVATSWRMISLGDWEYIEMTVRW